MATTQNIAALNVLEDALQRITANSAELSDPNAAALGTEAAQHITTAIKRLRRAVAAQLTADA